MGNNRSLGQLLCITLENKNFVNVSAVCKLSGIRELVKIIKRGVGAGVRVYLLFKECCFRVRVRVRVRVRWLGLGLGG